MVRQKESSPENLKKNHSPFFCHLYTEVLRYLFGLKPQLSVLWYVMLTKIIYDPYQAVYLLYHI